MHILVMDNGEEPGAKVGTALPVTLLGNCPDESVQDEVVCPGHVAGQYNSVAPQPWDLFFDKSTEAVHLSPQCSWQGVIWVWEPEQRAQT